MSDEERTTNEVPEGQNTGSESQEGTQRETEGSGVGEPESFPKDYVLKLREEAKEHRLRAEKAEGYRTRLLDAVVREGAAGILQDPSDLWSADVKPDDLCDDDGFPSAERVKTAAEELVKNKPHLARRPRPAGDIGQGVKVDEPRDPANVFAGMLKEAAG